MKRYIVHILFLFLSFILPIHTRGQELLCANFFAECDSPSDVDFASSGDACLTYLQSSSDYTIGGNNTSSILLPLQGRSIYCAKCKLLPRKRLKFYSPYANNRFFDIYTGKPYKYCTNCKFAGTTPQTILAVKSNLLYDALTLINGSVEAPIGDKFSALVYAQFPWWKWGESRNETCIRFLSLGAEGRWWFAPVHKSAATKYQDRDRLVGHFVGAYAEAGMWDFQFKRKLCRQGEFWSVGVSYGYSMPISRRMNLELSLSVGYASIPYRGYFPSENYEILWRDNENVGEWGYFGPTKAQVSLVVPIKASRKRGGSR